MSSKHVQHVAAMTSSESHRAIETVWRMESARLIAGLTRIVRDIEVAEELAQDALVAALQQWPETGVPRNPGAWLMAASRNRAIDHLRRTRLLDRKHESLGRDLEEANQRGVARGDLPPELEDTASYGDDLLKLIFTACHPVLAPESRVALTLRLLGGLSTGEIARAFLVPESTLAQRIVRAKRTLAESKVPFEVPGPAEISTRLSSVLEVLYLIFNEGYAATSGKDWTRPALCEEALRLGRILAELAPTEPEVHGLVALMEIQASRLRARINVSGEPVLLLDQDRSRWDWLLVTRGLRALERARSQLQARPGPYVLQAAIAGCHARARAAQHTDWKEIARLYTELAAITQSSPVVELGRAVALGMAYGPAVGLSLADELVNEPALRNSHRLPSVRGDLLFKLGRFSEAREEFDKAARLSLNEHESRLLAIRREEAAAAALVTIVTSDDV